MTREEAKKVLIKDMDRIRKQFRCGTGALGLSDGVAISLGLCHQALERYTQDEMSDPTNSKKG